MEVSVGCVFMPIFGALSTAKHHTNVKPCKCRCIRFRDDIIGDIFIIFRDSFFCCCKLGRGEVETKVIIIFSLQMSAGVRHKSL